jgi:hypothetical protein
MKPLALTRMIRLYRLLLAFYPKAHRVAYGPLMEQLFRDRCRELLNRRSRGDFARLWRHVFADFIVSMPSEHLAQLIHTMKIQNIEKLSFRLLLTAVLLSAVAAPVLINIGLAPACLYLSTLALLARAFAEWQRPGDEWARGLLWMLGMLLVYGLIIPFWIKTHLLHRDAYPSVPVVDVGAVLLNAAIPMIRPVLTWFGGHRGGQLPS